MNILEILAVILGITVVVRLMSVAQLATQLSGEEEKEEDIHDNRMNGFGMIVFMVVGLGLMIYMTFRFNHFMLPQAASIHGVETDNLLNINFAVIGIVFFITQIALFYFANKYKHNHGRRAYFYPENSKLELIWTIVPTIVLSALIVTGLKSWNNITQSKHSDGMNIEVYGYQFNWITRYSGIDNTLGRANFKLISDNNPLGMDESDSTSADDIMTKGNEMHLPVNVPIQFYFHSREVIHSAYFPHFRVQMNCVPGMTTNFYFVPTITTEQMRKITNNSAFDYVLLCNKICGVAHYTMHMKVVVDTPEDFKAWLKTQKPAVEHTAAETKTASIENPNGNKQLTANFKNN